MPYSAIDFTAFQTLTAAQMDTLAANDAYFNDSITAGAGKYAVGTFTSPASTGNKATTGVGFQPKMVRFTIGLTSATSSFMVLGGGAMTSTSQFAYAWGARSTLNGRHTRSASTTACLALLNISAGDVASDGYVASYVSMDADGFTVNFTTTATGATIYWEAYA